MHKGIQSHKFREKQKKRRRALTFLIVLCIVIILATVILIFRAPFFQIRNVAVESSISVPSAEISRVALESLQGSFLGIIPHSNIFYFSKKRIEKALESNFKHIDILTIHRNGFSGLRIAIQERMPTAIVCPGFRDEAEQGQCYLSDDRGYIFGSMSSSTPKALFDSLNHYYIPTEETLKEGNNFVSIGRFNELQKFMSGALRGGLLPLGVLVSENGEYEMYIKNRNGDSEVTVYFDDRSPFDTTLENLLTFWQNSVNAAKASTTPAFDYINLRFGNTVYYSTQ